MTPLIGNRRAAMPFDLMGSLVNESDLRGLLAGIMPEDKIDDFINPPDKIAEFLYGFSRTVEGREIIEWILDRTLRAPYHVSGQSIDQTAMNAARREGVNFTAELILAAINRGEQSIAARKSGQGK